MKSSQIKPLLIIIGIHLFGVYALFSAFINERFSQEYCLTHIEDPKISYFYNGQYHIVSNDQAIIIDETKPYIQKEYLTKFFEKDTCEFNIKNLKFTKSNSYSESLRLWRLDKDLNK